MWLFDISSCERAMGAEGSGMLSLRALNTITVTLALGLVALAGWHFQNPGHFELIQVPRSPPWLCCNLLRRQALRWSRVRETRALQHNAGASQHAARAS